MSDFIILTMGCGEKFYQRASTIDALTPRHSFIFRELLGSWITVGRDDYFVTESPDKIIRLIEEASK